MITGGILISILGLGTAVMAAGTVDGAPGPNAQEDDAAALKAARARFRSRSEADRLIALRDLALLNTNQAGGPSRSISDLIARGLKDDSFAVRAESARLLAKGEHPEVAVKSLVDALDDIRKEVAGLGRGARRQARQARERGKEPDPRLGPDARQYAEHVIDGLASLADDRSVRALAEFLVKTPRGAQGVSEVKISQALAALGARAGIEAIIQRLSGLESQANRQEGRKGGRRGRAPDATGRRIHQILLETARSKQLEGMPEWTDKADTEWRAWFAKNQKHFPAKLGRVEVQKD